MLFLFECLNQVIYALSIKQTNFKLDAKKFPLDISTHWNSTYSVLHSCMEYEKIITSNYNQSKSEVLLVEQDFF